MSTLDTKHYQSSLTPTDLTGFSKDHVFFTHALLFTHAEWDRDPVIDFWIENNIPTTDKPLLLHTPIEVFAGLDGWSNILLACPVQHWDKLRIFLSRIGGFHLATGSFHRTFFHPFLLTDPFQPLSTQKLAVNCLGIDGSSNKILFRPILDLAGNCHKLTVVITAPDQETVELTKKINEHYNY